MEKSLCFRKKPLAACGSKAIPRKQALLTSLRDRTGVAAFLNMNRLPAGQGQQQHYSYNFIDSEVNLTVGKRYHILHFKCSLQGAN